MIRLLIKNRKKEDVVIMMDSEDLIHIVGKTITSNVNGKYAYVVQNKEYLHRLILGISGTKKIADHINCNTHDNRRLNLRITNKSGNEFNKKKRKGSKGSIYKGVYFRTDYKRKNQWGAKITVNKKPISLGSYKT